MDATTEFSQQLADALLEYREYLEGTEFTKLREEFRMFYLAFEGIYKTLKKKGLIQDDPYRFEAKVAGLELPDQSNFLENERDDKMSIRLSQFDAQLDYINNYFQFSLDELTLDRIKLLAKITTYIRWNELTETNPSINTRSMAQYLMKIKHGGENLSAGIVKDSQDQLAKYGRSIRTRLKKITRYHRESYKLAIRQQITDTLSLEPTGNPAEQYMPQVKRAFMASMGDRPFYAELISEVLNEDFGPEREELQSALLKDLRPEREVKQKKKIGPSFEEMLLDAIRTMAQSSRALELCITKLNENHYLLENQRISLGTRLRRWFTHNVLKAHQERTYEIEYMDPVTSTRRTERVPYAAFSDMVLKKSKLYGGILGKIGTVATRLERAGEEQLFQFLHKNLEELQLIHRRLTGLDAFFKTEVSPDQRKQVRGIKNDLTTLKNTMVNANQKKHDYVSKKEEIEQLKKLGIQDV
ncbi:hypothetical protein [Spirochaeta africana]|nr:hypothetical protein [Spirochaeta africana]